MFSRSRRRRISGKRIGIRTPGVPPAHPGARHQRGRFHRFLVRRRRLLAGLLAAAAAGIAVQAALPPDPATVRTAAAASDLPAGHVIGRGDVRIISLPPGAVPQGAVTDAAAAVGRQLAVPLRGGGIVSETVLVGDGLLAGSPAGTAALPLRPADPATARLLSPGTLVDVVAAPEEGFDSAGPPVVLASGLPVLWITGTDNGARPWPGADTAVDEQLVVVAAPKTEAPELAVASARGGLYFVPNGFVPNEAPGSEPPAG
ncbi:flagellar biosynthesis protein FlgA [Arthrobacter gandavensis]|uniref:SAF domain-containing protein n=1 Tax=Arthrobacter gandavensis TaxID=169960 RepID=UPI00188DEA09|nr:SAF domain-containing protein [Arthrobacter gandavensis]MBF4993805.1 flagellar biosynthesis protein FlgA [Arthrobacter gandavensis]